MKRTLTGCQHYNCCDLIIMSLNSCYISIVGNKSKLLVPLVGEHCSSMVVLHLFKLKFIQLLCKLLTIYIKKTQFIVVAGPCHLCANHVNKK